MRTIHSHGKTHAQGTPVRLGLDAMPRLSLSAYLSVCLSQFHVIPFLP